MQGNIDTFNVAVQSDGSGIATLQLVTGEVFSFPLAAPGGDGGGGDGFNARPALLAVVDLLTQQNALLTQENTILSDLLTHFP